MTVGAPDAGSIGETPAAPAPARPTRRELTRDEIVATIPEGYSPAAHFLVPGAIGLGVLAACSWLAHDVRPVEWLTIPVTLFAGLAFEWRVHKSILHAKVPGLKILYVRHELHHHVIYTYDDMTMRSRREWRLVLMPAYAIVLVFAMLVPIAAALWHFLTPNVALLHVATSMIFFLAYEWMHLAYHLPQDHAVGRNPLIRKLRELHRRHHDPRLMKRWNFNVTVPLFDWLHGTAWTPERERIRREKKAARRAATPTTT
jgi:hypothetical protein